LYHTNKKNPFKQHFFPFDFLRYFSILSQSTFGREHFMKVHDGEDI